MVRRYIILVNTTRIRSQTGTQSPLEQQDNVCLYCLSPVVCVMMWFFFWPSTRQIYEDLNQSNIAGLHWFYLVTATCFDPYLDHLKHVMHY
jgi:hypothetical protein